MQIHMGANTADVRSPELTSALIANISPVTEQSSPATFMVASPVDGVRDGGTTGLRPAGVQVWGWHLVK